MNPSHMSAIQLALVDLTAAHRETITDQQLRVFDEALSEWREPDVKAVLKQMMTEPIGKLTLAMIINRLGPKANLVETSRAWAHPDGSWGGDWSKSTKASLLFHCGMMHQWKVGINQVKRAEFFEMCCSRGIEPEEIDEAAEQARSGILTKDSAAKILKRERVA